MNTQDYIQNTFENQPIVTVSGKKYCVNSLTDHLPLTKPELLEQIAKEMSDRVDYKNADFLVGEEDRGGYLSALMSFIWKKPFTLTTWNPSGFEGEISVNFQNAYTNGKLYLNGIKEFSGRKAIIVEDLIDTGGTIIAIVELLRKNNIQVIDVIAVAEKADYQGIERIEKETGIKPKVLISFSSGETHSKIIKRFK